MPAPKSPEVKLECDPQKEIIIQNPQSENLTLPSLTRRERRQQRRKTEPRQNCAVMLQLRSVCVWVFVHPSRGLSLLAPLEPRTIQLNKSCGFVLATAECCPEDCEERVVARVATCSTPRLCMWPCVSPIS